MRHNRFRSILAEESLRAASTMTFEQLMLYQDVISAVDHGRSMAVFLDGKAGTGKTHVIKAICSHLRSLQNIVIATATSAFAAQLYDGGRTVHSAFKVTTYFFLSAVNLTYLCFFLRCQSTEQTKCLSLI